MASNPSACAQCLEFEEQFREVRLQLDAVGQYVTYSPGPNSNPNPHHELQRWLAGSKTADAAAGFRAGWARLARFVGPRLRDWESRWQCAALDQARLKSRISEHQPAVARAVRCGVCHCTTCLN
jgi:hypothetical protein